jgi:beta-glucanase (GH16 family)
LAAPPSGYHLTFDDEFNTLKLSTYNSSGNLVNSNPANSGWLTRDAYDDTGYDGSPGSELEFYSNPDIDSYNPFSIHKGVLSITAEPTPSNMVGTGAGETEAPYVSGMLTSGQGEKYEPYNQSDGFSQEYGYFEMRCEVPQGAGMWPAFWMVPEPNRNTSNTNAEYDIFEIPVNPTGSQTENTRTIYETSHSDGTSDEHAYTLPAGEDASTAFHTYGFKWTPTSIKWYVDGVLTETQANVCNTPMYMLMNLAVGGSWPGSPTSASEFPASFKIDYVRVYSNSEGDPAVAPEPGRSVDPDTLDTIPVAPEPVSGGAFLVGWLYLAGLRPRVGGRERAIFSNQVRMFL